MPQGRAGAALQVAYPELSPPHPEGGAAPAEPRYASGLIFPCSRISLAEGTALTASCTCPVSKDRAGGAGQRQRMRRLMWVGELRRCCIMQSGWSLPHWLHLPGNHSRPLLVRNECCMA